MVLVSVAPLLFDSASLILPVFPRFASLRWPLLQNVGAHDFVGRFDCTVRTMLNPKSKFRLINDEKLAASQKPGGEKYKHSGTVTFKVAQHFSMIQDVDREADIALVKHRREYREAEVNPTKRKSFLAYMAGGQALVKAQALLRMATGLNSHKSAEELMTESNRARQQKEQQQTLATEGLQRMQTNLDLFKRAQAVDETVSISMRGESLAAMDFLTSDPFLEFYKLNRSSGAWEKCAQSEVVKNTLNPRWPPMLVKSRDLLTDASNPLDPKANPLQVRCFDWNADGKPDYMGTFTTSLPEIRKCKDTKFELLWSDPASASSPAASPTSAAGIAAPSPSSKAPKVKGTIVFESCKAVQVKVEKREVSQSNTLMDSGKKEKKKKRETLKRVATLSRNSMG